MTTPATPTTWLPESKEALVDYERYYSQKDRATMDASDFAGPHRSFPILTQQDVYNAARLIGHADDPEAVKRKIIAIAKRKGFKLPDSWQKDGEDGKAKESTTVVVGGNADGFTPKPRVARLKVCWIENDAISLNGRQYPRETVEKLIRNAQTDLADPNALPITCFISHGKADEDNSRDLVGRVTEIWQEGTKGYATIDIPDTAAGRDIAALAAYEYLTTVSLRASGADLCIDRTRGVPQVVERAGERLTLNGIDITTNPGLSKTARINQVILESADRPGLAEAFDLSEIPILEVAMATKSQQKADATTPVPGATTPAADAQASVITEEALSTLASGVSQGTDGSQTADGYQQKMMPLPPRANMDPATSAAGSPEHVSAMQEAHDRIAMVQGRSCAPGTESAYGQRLLQEAGRILSGKNDGHLDVAHDHLARALALFAERACQVIVRHIEMPVVFATEHAASFLEQALPIGAFSTGCAATALHHRDAVVCLLHGAYMLRRACRAGCRVHVGAWRKRHHFLLVAIRRLAVISPLRDATGECAERLFRNDRGLRVGSRCGCAWHRCRRVRLLLRFCCHRNLQNRDFREIEGLGKSGAIRRLQDHLVDASRLAEAGIGGDVDAIERQPLSCPLDYLWNAACAICAQVCPGCAQRDGGEVFVGGQGGDIPPGGCIRDVDGRIALAAFLPDLRHPPNQVA